MRCPNCGGSIIGNGFSEVLRCENAEEEAYTYVEPDADVVLCDAVDDEPNPTSKPYIIDLVKVGEGVFRTVDSWGPKNCYMSVKPVDNGRVKLEAWLQGYKDPIASTILTKHGRQDYWDAVIAEGNRVKVYLKESVGELVFNSLK